MPKTPESVQNTVKELLDHYNHLQSSIADICYFSFGPPDTAKGLLLSQLIEKRKLLVKQIRGYGDAALLEILNTWELAGIYDLERLWLEFLLSDEADKID